jgi:hypothetical protein
MPKAKHHSHTGTFVSASADKLVMTGHNGKEHTHPVAKSVTVTIDGKPGQLAALKKGMQITVTTDANGTVTAISTPPAKPTAARQPASSKQPVPSVAGARK